MFNYVSTTPLPRISFRICIYISISQLIATRLLKMVERETVATRSGRKLVRALFEKSSPLNPAAVVFDGPNNRCLMSGDYPAPGLRASARVIPEGFIGHHRCIHAHKVTYLWSDQPWTSRGCRGNALRFLQHPRPASPVN